MTDLTNKDKVTSIKDKGPIKAQKAAPDVTNIWERINNFTQEFGGVVKDKTNDFYNADYADLVTVWSTIRPALDKYGIGISQMPGSYAVEGALVPTLITQLYCVGRNSPAMGDPGWQVSTQTPLVMDKQSSQGFGSALKYQRRYHIITMLNIPEYDDDGQAEEDARISARVTQEAKDELEALVNKSSKPETLVDWIKTKHGVAAEDNYLDKLNPGQVASVITSIKAKASA